MTPLEVSNREVLLFLAFAFVLMALYGHVFYASTARFDEKDTILRSG